MCPKAFVCLRVGGLKRNLTPWGQHDRWPYYWLTQKNHENTQKTKIFLDVNAVVYAKNLKTMSSMAMSLWPVTLTVAAMTITQESKVFEPIIGIFNFSHLLNASIEIQTFLNHWSLGALLVPTLSWRPFRPLNFVLRALRAVWPTQLLFEVR